MSGRDASASGSELSVGALGRLLAPGPALRLAASLVGRPASVLRRGAGLVTELGQVGLGTSTVAPHRADRRFADPGWLTHPLRRRAMQTYLATTGALAGLLDDAGAIDGAPGPSLEPGDEARLREILDILSDLLCPAGPPVQGAPEPAGPLDTGTPDRNGGLQPGRDIAPTPGAVVHRTPMCELLQYLPQTEQVHDVAVLVVPPLVHRYYLVDLAPQHSLVGHLVRSRHQVFAMSWPDPGPADAGRGLDAYVAAVLEAVAVCTRITRCTRVELLGVRTGGLLAAAAQSHLLATGTDDRIAGVAYLGTVLDQSTSLPGFHLDAASTRAATDRATRDGVLDGPSAVTAWTWRRGGEQVQPHGVGPDRATGQLSARAGDALRHWSQDLLAMPAALHTDLVALAGAGAATVLGTPFEPRRLSGDAYLVVGADDPVQRWTGGYRTAELLGGRCRLVLADGDQVGGLIVPPERADGASYRVGAEPVAEGGYTGPDDWLGRSTATPGSWWDDLTCWLGERAGTLRDAPPELGGRRLHPVHPAPGTYLPG